MGRTRLALGTLKGLPVARFGRVTVNDRIACLIRAECARQGCPEYIAMGIVSAESGFDPNAVGDNGRSIGLLQLYVDGGQGSAYRDNPDALKDPVLNLSIGIRPIALAAFEATRRGYTGERYIREVARSSGHPGFVDLNDARLTNIVNATYRLIFNADGSFAQWPPNDPRNCGGTPPPPPPIGSWTEGVAPRNEEEAEAAITAHLVRVVQLLKSF